MLCVNSSTEITDIALEQHENRTNKNSTKFDTQQKSLIEFPLKINVYDVNTYSFWIVSLTKSYEFYFLNLFYIS